MRVLVMLAVALAISQVEARGVRVKSYKPRVPHSKLSVTKVRVRR